MHQQHDNRRYPASADGAVTLEKRTEHRQALHPRDIAPAVMPLSWNDPPVSVTFEIVPFADLDRDLMAAEAESLSRHAGDRRRRDFIAGRNLARRLLAARGYRDHALLQLAGGAPQWPKGVSGSISHCRDLVFAAVASVEKVSAIGVDIENLARFHDGLAGQILTEDELARLPVQAAARRRQMAISFSAKEAFYKCQFVRFGEKLTFQDAEIGVCVQTQTLSIHMTDPERHGRLAIDVAGFYAVNDTHVATMVLRHLPMAAAE
jgi:4'-phosphopantetheinyl transferase EntD